MDSTDVVIIVPMSPSGCKYVTQMAVGLDMITPGNDRGRGETCWISHTASCKNLDVAKGNEHFFFHSLKRLEIQY